MTPGRPPIPARTWLVLAVGVAVFAAVLTAGYVTKPKASRTHPPLAVKASETGNTTERDGVELSTSLSLRHTNSLFEVVATVSILNTTDQPIAYVGSACADPATTNLQSTQPVPAGPKYGTSSAALRARVMDYRRSLDGGSPMFREESPANKSCDDLAPPLLAPHAQLTFTSSDGIDSPSYQFVDSATTDVVTTVQLGMLPPTATETNPLPVRPTDSVVVRIPLAPLATVVKPLVARYDVADLRFAAAMRVASIGAWIAAQDPASWHDVTLQDTNTTGGWKLVAFSRAWAEPLVVSGANNRVDSYNIPTERIETAPSVDASAPTAATLTRGGYLADRDIYAGDLVLPSGTAMVGDPVSSDGMLKFAYGVPPGRYPVHVVTARPPFLSEEYARPAYEELLLTGATITRWEPAIPVAHSAHELKPGELFVWSTDGGSAGFASPEAMKLVDATLTKDDFGYYGDLTNRETANGSAWAFLTVDHKDGANVFGCESGFGDGAYPVLLGVDEHGRPVALLSDFGVLSLRFSGIS